MSRFLTKSLFRLAMDCPAKLYYSRNAEYVNKKIDDPFLDALAKGGFQVGELARQYYPTGVLVSEIDHAAACAKTQELLQAENVIIFEAAFQYKDFFIRTDIIRKAGNKIDLLEVKAKSYHPVKEKFYLENGTGIHSGWKEYFQDVAFQYYVLIKAVTGFQVTPYLMLADKASVATADGLNQLFHLSTDARGRTKVIVAPGLTPDRLGDRILGEVPAMPGVRMILEEVIDGKVFSERVSSLSADYLENNWIEPKLSSNCRDCEFKATAEEQVLGKKSGFHKCWTKVGGLQPNDFSRPSILEVWNFSAMKDFIPVGIYFQDGLSQSDVMPKKESKKAGAPKPGMSAGDRRWVQVSKSAANDNTVFVDRPGLKREMDNCRYPLHFIDFETSAVAIPFNKGRRPYEQMAFQFSHHALDEKNGTIRHAGQWINTEVGQFPNFEFIRALKAELSNDDGSIFRYADHENNILNAIYEQLNASDEPDKESLKDWIRTVSKSTGKSTEKWEGERNMIDMLQWVKGFYYNPVMKGSNSIKHVLPAMLADSRFLRNKYSQPIYGSDLIPSLNFTGHTWLTFTPDGKCISPYKTLPKLDTDFDFQTLDLMFIDEGKGIEDGGAAMTAYARMQFTQMSDEERTRIQDALLRYCELDTMAMVMLWEGWREICQR